MPTIGEEELTEVMLEFAQRVQSERKLGSGVPPPFEITTTVVHLGQTKLPERPKMVYDNPQQQGALVIIEPNFNFGQNHFVAPGGNITFTLDVQLQCHDDNAVTNEVYVRVPLAKWSKPGFGEGPLHPAFLGSTWTPSQTDEAPTVAQCTWTIGPPVPTASPYSIQIQFNLQYVDSGKFGENYTLIGEHQEFWTVHNEGDPPYIETNFSVF